MNFGNLPLLSLKYAGNWLSGEKHCESGCRSNP